MPIEFRCSQCGKLLRTGDGTTGQQAQCPECGALSQVPAPGEPSSATPPLEPLRAGGVGAPDTSSGNPFAAELLNAATASDNPYQSPQESAYQLLPGQPDPFAAQRVSGPATALTVTAILGMVVQVLGVISNVLQITMGAGGPPRGHDGLPIMLMGGVYLALGLFGLAMGVLVLIGARRMRNLESYSLAMTAAIVAMVPCVSPCCLLGLPFGIWALLVLGDSSVKSAFRS